jgi:hypothetical protein
MQIKIRSRNDRLDVTDENGNVIPGVVFVEMQPWKPGDAKAKFRIGIEVEAKAAIDGEAAVSEVRAPGKSKEPAGPKESEVKIGDGDPPKAAGENKASAKG